MVTAVLTGANSPLGLRVADLLAGDDIEVVRIDETVHPASEQTPDHLPVTADVVVDVGTSDYDRRAQRRESASEFVMSSLAAADRFCADQIVFVSSALVYGAAPNNPKPLTEDAVLRPDVEFVFARQLASAEELVDEWRRARPGRVTSVLRPVVSLARGDSSRLAAALVSGLGHRIAQNDPPSQFLHLDDLAAAVALAVRKRLDGVFNVAPDGWVPGERVRALSGERPRFPMPERLSEVVASLRWRFQRGPLPPGLRPYTREPWIVSNGRLSDAGWEPTVTNEQAYVEATEAPWWTMVSPKRRQELTLGAAVAGTALVAAIAFVVGRRWWRRR
ncbi:NAD-dependent epimerase/dehydratase family protein [Ilumatobacter nonamiensis]|uniref:NAD-dependent epimerase/dehydratase family protein n=1 Tax=Ilumatobacter nonamiensis TaxID=467093 RepID=UPI00058AD6F5|nr:NAD-dependent epimerase/dehydratase family protein [Ilumatobacter nonamiensis]